jgi:cell division protein ZapB
MENDAMQQLEHQIDELLHAGRRLRDENILLKAQQSTWISERAQLVEKTEVARTRIEKMVSHLKELDDDL